MVFSAASEAEPLPKRMATEKPHPLHNFSMPVLKWGNQRILRCMKPSPHGEISGSSLARRLQPSDAGSAGGSSPNLSGVRKPLTPSPLEKLRKASPLRPQPPPEEEPADAGIEQLRAKLEDHLQTAADQMRYKVPEQREDAESSQPWNLRTRRAALKAPAVESGGGNGRSSPPLAVPAAAAGNSTRSRLRGLAADSQIVEKKEKMKFSVPLSREEIEEDFFIITGSRPPRRPKKRAKMIQRQLDEVFPGLWLSEVTPDTYKVDDLPEAGKR
ncbi:hypothetical protein MRB53_024017 [Persea americana]|uniref:Uncharacterized protein n=1 Tax=Persea americana TaxID=3435 RepID=A0ACC2LB65_PERAE|nr:hypothetical protein MRB53_024017 [Persea americana]